MIIIGGLGSILGSIFGAVFMTVLPEFLKLIPDLLRGSYPIVAERACRYKSDSLRTNYNVVCNNRTKRAETVSGII